MARYQHLLLSRKLSKTEPFVHSFPGSNPSTLALLAFALLSTFATPLVVQIFSNRQEYGSVF